MSLFLFIPIALFMIVSTCVVSFSRNLIYSAFALLGTLFGSAVLYGMLSADFVAVAQLLIYVGGILILILFAVMLTTGIADIKITNKSVYGKWALPVFFLLLFGLLSLLVGVDWPVAKEVTAQSMVRPIGHALLKEYLLPFEVISILLLGALVGAVVIVRREVR
jgi:NAD(P)H-quinone oxidoreductase subunit 6